jgi:hypothetical protein
MARRDLAGLAALGALGMMMSKDKKIADRDTDTGVEVQPSYAQSSSKPPMMADLGEIRDEDGTLSKFRRNTETGDLYTLDKDLASPSARLSKTTSSKSKLGSGTKDDQYNPDVKMRMKDDQYNPDVKTRIDPDLVDVTKLSLAERSKLSRERSRSEGTKTDTRSLNERMRSSFGMKKGGTIKKMASGGMTSSASKRADGIASKGKTRGKLC